MFYSSFQSSQQSSLKQKTMHKLLDFISILIKYKHNKTHHFMFTKRWICKIWYINGEWSNLILALIKINNVQSSMVIIYSKLLLGMFDYTKMVLRRQKSVKGSWRYAFYSCFEVLTEPAAHCWSQLSHCLRPCSMHRLLMKESTFLIVSASEGLHNMLSQLD